jgi:phospholipid/cholesterol/gamma-HCH transport system substrate-binding protein
LKISREVKIGFVVIVTLAIAVWGYNWLKGNNILAKNREYYAVYNNVGGLTPNSPVVVNGFQVGQVSDIHLMDKPGLVLVTFKITDKKFKFPRDSQARLASTSLLGGKTIEIILGDSSVYAVPGDTLYTQYQMDLQQQVEGIVAPLKIKVDGILSSIDSILVPIQMILNDETATKLADGLGRIPKIIANLERITYKVDTLISSEKNKLSRIFSNVESISANLKNNNDKISSILDNVDEITDSLAKSNFKKAIANATDILEKVDNIVTKIDNGEGTLGALINDDKLYLQIDSAARNLNFLVDDIGQNPERYLHFSLIHINKNPKKQKKGGKNGGG